VKSAKELVTQANLRIDTMSVKEAMTLLNDPNTVFIDLRDSAEIKEEGRIPGAVHVERGLLEFAIDPTMSMHNPIFASGKDFIFYCAGGGRSALATDTAQNMGLENVCHIAGGFKAWKEANGPVVRESEEQSSRA